MYPVRIVRSVSTTLSEHPTNKRFAALDSLVLFLRNSTPIVAFLPANPPLERGLVGLSATFYVLVEPPLFLPRFQPLRAPPRNPSLQVAQRLTLPLKQTLPHLLESFLVVTFLKASTLYAVVNRTETLARNLAF